MTPCDGTANSSTWCCGSSSSCCGTNDAISIAQTLGSGLATTTTTTPSIRTIIPTTIATGASTSQTPASTSSSFSSPSSGLSSGAKAGISVGVALGSIGIITTTLGLFLIRRRKTRKGIEERIPQPSNIDAVPNKYTFAVPQEKPHDPIDNVRELPGMPVVQRYELPSEHR